MRRTVTVAAFVLGSMTLASADTEPHLDAIARHDDEVVRSLRAQLPGDEVTRCTLGAVYAKRSELSLAMLYLQGCLTTALPPALAAVVTPIARDTAKQARASSLGELVITSRPEGLAVYIDVLPDEALTTPTTVWVPAGDHAVATSHPSGDLAITRITTVREYSRSQVVLIPDPPPVRERFMMRCIPEDEMRRASERVRASQARSLARSPVERPRLRPRVRPWRWR